MKKQRMIKISSLDGGFQDKIGIFLILFIELFHPSSKYIRRYNKVFPTVLIVDQHLSIMVAHHEIVQIMSYKFRVLFLSI